MMTNRKILIDNATLSGVERLLGISKTKKSKSADAIVTTPTSFSAIAAKGETAELVKEFSAVIKFLGLRVRDSVPGWLSTTSGQNKCQR